jgi:hypothetical protein
MRHARVRPHGGPAVEQAYERARMLSEQADDRPLLIQSLTGLATLYVTRAKFDRAAEAARAVTKLRDVIPSPRSRR